jgi:hypothetical protein
VDSTTSPISGLAHTSTPALKHESTQVTPSGRGFGAGSTVTCTSSIPALLLPLMRSQRSNMALITWRSEIVRSPFHLAASPMLCLVLVRDRGAWSKPAGGFILDGVRGVPDEANPENASAPFQSVHTHAPCDLPYQGRLHIVRVIAAGPPW